MADLTINVNTQGVVPEPTQINNGITGNTEFPQSTNQTSQYAGMIKAAGIGIGKKAINDGLRRVGDLTGRRGLQTRIDNITKVGNYGANIAMGFFAFGAVGAGIAFASAGYDVIIAQSDIRNDNFLDQAKREYLQSYALKINSNNRSKGNL